MKAPEKTATVYRMVMPKHTCPYGLKTRWLLRSAGYAVDDHWITTREQQDAFKREHDVATTPQTFIDGRRIGGYDDVRRFLNKPVPDKTTRSYKPIIALLAIAALLAAATVLPQGLDALLFTRRFVAFAMVLLALQKLQDVASFSTMFLNYDLLAQRWVPYAYVYPFAEAAAGLLMLAGVLPLLAAPVALFIGGVGAVSVFYAVYVQKRELKCACVGGNTNVPLGAVSLAENVVMVAMAVWTLAAQLGLGR